MLSLAEWNQVIEEMADNEDYQDEDRDQQKKERVETLQSEFPYNDVDDLNAEALRDLITEWFARKGEEWDQAQTEWECSIPDKPLSDAERYFLNFGTMDGY